MKESDVAEGTSTNGARPWAPRASVNAARLDGGWYMHEEGKGTNGATRWAPCGNDYAA